MKFGEDRPGIVHRIDKETSGLLVVAKNDSSHQNLSDQFKERSINRLYEAVCVGVPSLKESKITSVIARHPTDRKRFASLKDASGKIVRDPSTDPAVGKIAITSYKVLNSKITASLIQLKLFTGRTHQIRVHMSELGHPLLGDKLYSNAQVAKKISGEMKLELESMNRFLLHAKVLGFTHPKTQKLMHFEVDWPEAEKKFIQKWFL
jgi:23S rRNA pseudouridine1911/1915/1917 synthase